MNIRFAHSLRGRFIIFIGGLSILTTLLLASFHFFQVRSALLGQLEKRGFSVAEQVVQAVTRDIQDDNLDDIEDYLWDTCSDPEVRFVILQDERGQILADCSHASVDLSFIRSHFVAESWRPDQAEFSRIETSEESLFSFSSPVFASGRNGKRLGTVRIGITTGPTLASIDRAFWVGIGTWVILGSIGLLGVGFITRLALAPLDRMVGVARSISKGDMSQRVEIDAVDEIGSLGVAFNEMSASLAASRDALDARNRELEQVARDRELSLAELKEAQDRLAHSEGTRHAEKLRSVGQMASGVAHDFNNVLAAITGRTQLLKIKLEKDVDGDQSLKDSLNVIERAALDGAETVRRIQEFSREQHEKAMTRADLNHIVREAVEITRPRWRSQAEQHGARVEVETELPRIPQIACVPSEIREILTNLIFNSVDAMDSGGTIAIRTESLEDGVQLVLTDTGSGMPDSVKEHIFEPFFTTKGLNGNGLGLSIVYGIVRRHGGEITVSDNEGGGTKFTLCFPQAKADTPSIGRELMMKNRSARILVADDEANVRHALVEILISLGHHVTEVADGRGILEAFDTEQFDMVFTDLGMPDLSGWDVVAAIREKDQEIPVVLVTGWGNQLSPSDAEAQGVTRIIAKPFTIQKISSVIAEIQGFCQAA